MSWSEQSASLGSPIASFATRLERYGDAVAVISESGDRVTYAELAAKADAFASELGPTPRLLLIEAKNQLPPLVAYLGALRHGHPVILAAAESGPQLDRIIDIYRPDARVHEAASGWVTDTSMAPARIFHPDLAVLLSTSGSTGAAKLVRLSHAAVDANARSIAEYLGIISDDRAITTLPIHYSFGLSVVASHLESGATLLLTDSSVKDEGFWDFFDAEAATSLAGVPFTYDLLERIGFREASHPSLHTMTQAGGRLPPDMVRTFGEWARNNGVRFFVMYGQTEATARMAYVPPAALLDHPDCIGVPIPQGAFHLIDEDGQRIDMPGVPGELVYSGPNVMLGYALTEADLAKGREVFELKTGDLAVRNPQGFYRIVGRKSRFSKLFGLRISLDEIEATLARHGVRSVVAGDDTILAVAALRDDPGKAAAIIAKQFDLPTSVISIVAYDEAPTLASGKFDYQAILKAAKDQAENTANVGQSVAALFRQAFPSAHLHSTDSFVSLGGDSLSYVRLSLELERHLGTLPERWEEQAIAQLEKLAEHVKKPAGGFFAMRGMESEVVIRAAAILAVVANHASTLTVGGGAHVLLMLSGYNLSRYQRSRLTSGHGSGVLTAFFRRILIPYLAILLAYMAAKRTLDVPSLLLVSNFSGRFGSLLEPYWFLEVLFQCMIILVGLFSFAPARRFAARDPWRFGLALLAGALIVRVAAYRIFDHADLLERTPDAVFYLFAFGWCLHQANTRSRRILLTAIGAVLACIQIVGPNEFWSHFAYPTSWSHAVWFAAAIGLILWMPRLLIPNALHMLIGVVATASFYIYLTHGVPVHILVWILGIHNLAIVLPVAVAIGVSAYWTSQRLANFWQQRSVDSVTFE